MAVDTFRDNVIVTCDVSGGAPNTGAFKWLAAVTDATNGDALTPDASGAAATGETHSIVFQDGNAMSLEEGCAYTKSTKTWARGTMIWSTTGSQLSLSSAAKATIVAPSDALTSPWIAPKPGARPAAPSSGLVLFDQAWAGWDWPAMINAEGEAWPFMPMPTGGGVPAMGLPQRGSATFSSLNGGGLSSGGLGAATQSNTNLFTSASRVTLSTSSSSGARAQVHNTGTVISPGSGFGGFRCVMRFGISAYTAGMNFAAGFANAAFPSSGADPSAALNTVIFGKDAADTTLQVMHNDGSGTATKIDLGANFPANTANIDWYEAWLTFLASGNVAYAVMRLNTGDFASGTISSDLPAANTSLILPQFNVTNGAVAAAVSLDVGGYYLNGI